MKYLSKANDRTIKIFLYLIFATGLIFCGLKLTVPGVLDEVGTLANTAFLAGDNWCLCTQSMGGFYYKYGQAPLFLPFYLIFGKNSYTLYPALITFQMVMLSFIPVIAYHIARKYLKIESKLTALLISVGGAGISSIWLYAQYTRGDSMLILLPWVLVLLFLKLSTLNKTDHKLKRILYSIVLAFVSVYAYMTHSRGIVFTIATIITVFFFSIFVKKHLVNYFAYISATGIFLVIDKILSRYFKAGVFGPYDPKHASLENINFHDILKIFTKNGFIVYMKTVIGWVLNLATSTMGLVLIGVLATLFVTLKIIRKKSELTLQENIIGFFSLMIMLGVFFMGSIFFFPHIYDMFMGINVERADRVVFGRYTVSAVGLICFFALYILICKKDVILKWKSKLFCAISFGAIIAIFGKFVGPQLNGVKTTDARYFLSLTALLDIQNAQTTAPFSDLNRTLVLASLMSLGVFIIIMVLSFVKKKRVLQSICIIVFALSLINFTAVFTKVRLVRDSSLYVGGFKVINFITDVDKTSNISEDYPIIYIANEKSKYTALDGARGVKHYQYSLVKFDCTLMKYILDTDTTEFLVVAKKGMVPRTIECINQKFEVHDDYYTFDSFDYENANRDVIIVKGNNLAKKLENAGYKLSVYNEINIK